MLVRKEYIFFSVVVDDSGMSCIAAEKTTQQSTAEVCFAKKEKRMSMWKEILLVASVTLSACGGEISPEQQREFCAKHSEYVCLSMNFFIDGERTKTVAWDYKTGVHVVEYAIGTSPECTRTEDFRRAQEGYFPYSLSIWLVPDLPGGEEPCPKAQGRRYEAQSIVQGGRVVKATATLSWDKPYYTSPNSMYLLDFDLR